MLSIAKVTNSPMLERKIEETAAGLPSSFAKHLCSTGEDNAVTIVEYIAAVKWGQPVWQLQEGSDWIAT